MNSVGELIAFQDSSFLLLSKAQRTELQTTVILYLFRGCSSQDLSSAFKTTLGWSGQDCIDFRKELYRSGYLQKNFKLYIYARLCGTKTSPKDFEVPLKDSTLVGKIAASQTLTSQRLKALCASSYAEGYKVRSLVSFDKGVARVMQDLNEAAYCQKFVGKKFSFLTKPGQKDEESLVAELYEFALRAAYRAYPNIEGILHLTNIMKQAIHNRGINIIKEETTQGRSRLKKSKDGTFVGLLLSLDYSDFEQTFAMEQQGSGGLNVCNSLMCGLDGTSCEYERPQDVDRKRDLRDTVNHLFTRLKGEAPRKFLTLLMGEPDKDFSRWLGQPNDEAAIKLTRTVYVEKVREYMDVPVAKAADLFAKLKVELQDFRN